MIPLDVGAGRLLRLAWRSQDDIRVPMAFTYTTQQRGERQFTHTYNIHCLVWDMSTRQLLSCEVTWVWGYEGIRVWRYEGMMVWEYEQGKPTPFRRDQETRGHSSPIMYFCKAVSLPVAWFIMYAFGDWLMYGWFIKARNTFGVFLVLLVVSKQGKGACRARVHTHTHTHTSHGAHVCICIVYSTMRCRHSTI